MLSLRVAKYELKLYQLEISMTPSLRTANLHLTRHLCDGLGKLAAQLNSVTNEAALIKMGQEKKGHY